MREIHVIPVPAGMTPEQAFEEICVFYELLDPSLIEYWAVIECEGE